MRSAPAVTVRCTGGPLWRVVLCGLPAVAAAALVYWAALHAEWGPAAGLWAALVCAAAAAGVAVLQLPPAAQLRWDGAAWTCDGWLVRPQVMVDTGGAWLLLRLQPADADAEADADADAGVDASDPEPTAPALVGGRPARWLAVSQRDAGAAWHALRAAVYCRPPEPPPTGNARQPP